MGLTEDHAAAHVERCAKTGLLYRPSLGERFVIDEQSQYDALEVDGLHVMDVGANIGSFAQRVLRRGASHVLCFEPTPLTYIVLRRNLGDVQRCALRQVALVGGDEKEIPFYLSKRFPAAHSVDPVRGRVEVRVAAANFWTEIEAYKPSVLKLDIEGGEYGLGLEAERLPWSVDQVAMELHMGRKGQRDKAIAMASSFSSWFAVRKFRFNWSLTTLVVRRNKPSELGRVGDMMGKLI